MPSSGCLQVLLRVGIVRSRKAPTSLHPYGYLKDKFVWSLVSAVGIFCLGAGITTAHGFSSLLAGPQALDNLGYGLSGRTNTVILSTSSGSRAAGESVTGPGLRSDFEHAWTSDVRVATFAPLLVLVFVFLKMTQGRDFTYSVQCLQVSVRQGMSR